MAQRKAGRSAFRVEFDFSESSFRFKPSYDKTYYKVVHVPTGDVWDARLDIQHPSEHGGKALSVAARIESYCKQMLASKRPRTEEEAEGYRRWLERIRPSSR